MRRPQAAQAQVLVVSTETAVVPSRIVMTLVDEMAMAQVRVAVGA